MKEQFNQVCDWHRKVMLSARCKILDEGGKIPSEYEDVKIWDPKMFTDKSLFEQYPSMFLNLNYKGCGRLFPFSGILT